MKMKREDNTKYNLKEILECDERDKELLKAVVESGLYPVGEPVWDTRTNRLNDNILYSTVTIRVKSCDLVDLYLLCYDHLKINLKHVFVQGMGKELEIKIDLKNAYW